MIDFFITLYAIRNAPGNVPKDLIDDLVEHCSRNISSLKSQIIQINGLHFIKSRLENHVSTQIGSLS